MPLLPTVRPSVRLRQKTTVAPVAEQVLVGVGLGPEADSSSRRIVYLVTLTTKLSDLKRLEALAADDPQRCAEASMMTRRLRVYRFSTRIPKPSTAAEYCGHCFAKLILSRGVSDTHGLWSKAESTIFV